jgi:hypothetical protein
MKTAALSLTLLIGFSFVADAAEKEPDAGCNLISKQLGCGELAGWKSFHEPDAKTSDVWTLGEDGVLVCKGSPKGYIYTTKDYENFVLELEWRWPKDKKPGNGGALIRMTGKHKIWPKCLEAQINVGNAGDLVGLDGYTFTGAEDRTTKIDHPKFGKIIITGKTEAVEKPVGEWNAYKITADGKNVTLEVNGKVVNRATDADAKPGKILLTAEGQEIHFRNVKIRAIK